MRTITPRKIREKIASMFDQRISSFRKKWIVDRMKRWKPVYGLNQTPREKRIIVSLTSYPPRFASISLALKSLLWQTMKPDRIIVWLSCGPEDITQEMHSYEQYGITFRYHVPDYKSHKKYVFAFTEFPDDIVITVDDDVVYSPDLIASLLMVHHRFPNSVCARTVHKMTWDTQGKMLEYRKWNKRWKQCRTPSNELVAIGVGGVLYPPHCFDNLVCDSDLFFRLAPGQDDLWLKWMEMLKGIDVVWTPNNLTAPPDTEGSQIVALNAVNANGHGNDDAIVALSRYFGAITPDGFVSNKNTSR